MTDTGPAYPPPPSAGSNAIGSFQIGVSPIGTIDVFDPWQTIISQYANSPTLISVIESFSDAIDLTEDWDSFFSNIFDIDTAFGFGLDLLGRIVRVARNVQVTVPRNYFSFDDPARGFDNADAPVFGPTSSETSSVQISLSDDDYRSLLLAKAALNIGVATSPGITAILNVFFAKFGAKIFVNEATEQPLSFLICQAGTQLSVLTLAILQGALGVRPAGVGVAYALTTGNGPLFGFDMENDYVSGFDVGYIDASPTTYLAMMPAYNVSLASFVVHIGGLSYVINGGVITSTGPLSMTAQNLGMRLNGGVLELEPTAPNTGWIMLLPTNETTPGNVWLNGNIFMVA